MRIIDNVTPKASAGKSQGAVSDQGYTYNQATFTYNQAGVTYGGFYGFAQVLPTISLTSSVVPSIVGYADIYTSQGTVPANTNHSIGPGWFMYVTIP